MREAAKVGYSRQLEAAAPVLQVDGEWRTEARPLKKKPSREREGL